MFHIAVFLLKAKKLLIFQGSEFQIEIWKESLCLMYILFQIYEGLNGVVAFTVIG